MIAGETKIRALLEDMTMSVDVQDVYSKLKLNVGAVGISHFQRQGYCCNVCLLYIA